MELNIGQKIAFDDICKFIKSSDGVYYLLDGQPGVGKTTLLKFIKKAFPTKRFAMTAPVGKAVRNMKNVIQYEDVTYCTTHSLLGLKMVADGEYKVLSDSKSKRKGLRDYDIVIIDECSMIGKELFDYIVDKVSYCYNTKILFVGDIDQLPPVNKDDKQEEISPVFTSNFPKNTLTFVERHGSDILSTVNSIKHKMYHPLEQIKYFQEDGSVNVVTYQEDFEALIKENYKGFFENDKVVTWTNAALEKYNTLIRSMNFKGDAKTLWLPSDKCILTSPVKLSENEFIPNSTEGIVKSAMIVSNNIYPQFRSYRLEVDTDDGDKIILYTLHNGDKKKVQRELDTIASAAKVDKRYWKDFWKLSDSFHGVSHNYASSSHRSQGSTFDTVYVDANDIFRNYTRKTALQCMYVACSRASNKLIISL